VRLDREEDPSSLQMQAHPITTRSLQNFEPATTSLPASNPPCIGHDAISSYMTIAVNAVIQRLKPVAACCARLSGPFQSWGPLDPLCRYCCCHLCMYSAWELKTPLLRDHKIRPATWHCVEKHVGLLWNAHVEAFSKVYCDWSFHVSVSNRAMTDVRPAIVGCKM
jgi:hypothetical protein